MTGRKILSTIRSYGIITVGLFLYTFAWTVFIIPNQMVGGGVTGISAIIQYLTGFDVSYSYFIINTVLLVIAMKVLGSGFGVKTIFAMLVSTIFLRFLPELISQDFIQEISIENGKLLCAMIGGAISGFGVALTFSQGGSSGGTDIVALIINKYRAISPGKVIMTIDILIIASSLFLPSDGTWGGRIATVLYGYVVSGVFSVTVDMVTSGTKQSIQVFIFSRKYAEIADAVSTEFHRGTTLLKGIGWHTKQDINVVVTITRKHDTNALLTLIRSIDPDAFISVSSVMGVYGKGFEQVKK